MLFRIERVSVIDLSGWMAQVSQSLVCRHLGQIVMLAKHFTHSPYLRNFDISVNCSWHSLLWNATYLLAEESRGSSYHRRPNCFSEASVT